jgi:hypothetical protein
VNDHDDDDQADDVPYRDSYQEAEQDWGKTWDALRDAANDLKAAASSIREVGRAVDADQSFGESIPAQCDALARATFHPGIGAPNPDDRVLWKVVGRPVRLGDNRAWILQDRTRRQDPVWDLLDNAMQSIRSLPASGVFAAAVILLRANYRLDLDEAWSLIEPTDPQSLLPIVMSAMAGQDIVPVQTEGRPLIFDDSPQEGEETGPD